MLRTITLSLAVMLTLYCAAMLALWIFQRSFFYLPDQSQATPQQLQAAGFAEIAVEIPDIGPMTSYWRPPADPSMPVFLHLHGNAGNAARRLPLYQTLAEEGAGVLGVGYPGYGGNPGKPGEMPFFAASLAHYNWLIGRGITAGRIIIFGQSIGTGAATWLATENCAAALFLEAPFTGLDDVAARQLPYFPVGWLTADRFRSAERIGKINMPLLWIHGKQDDLIPFAMGARLFDIAKQPKRALSLDQAGHNDIWAYPIAPALRQQAAKDAARGRCNSQQN